MAVIELLGKILSNIDELRGSLDSNSAERKALDDLRDKISKRRETLTIIFFQENTSVYKKITPEISKINGTLQGSIHEIEKTAETLKTLAQLMTAVDELIKITAEALV
ncbi:MAG: hypothetical protein WC484_05735 [Candidatus Omnitrophota bacterium]